MIRIYLSSYEGNILKYLDFIYENAWLYYVKKFYIDDNTFDSNNINHVIDLKYYPFLLKTKENIDTEYIKKIEEKDFIDLKNESLDEIVYKYIFDKIYYIKFDDLVNTNNNIKYFIQLINKIKFNKFIDNEKIIMKGEIKNVTYNIVFNKLNVSIYYQVNKNNIKLSSNDNLISIDKTIIKSNGFLIFYI